MTYSKNQKVLYKTLVNKKIPATILLRKVDFADGFINDGHATSAADYLISVEGKSSPVFCMETDLESFDN